MLADCLTKTMDSSVLRECLRTGRYALRDETFLLKERLSARERLKWVKQYRHEKDPSEEDVAMTMNEDGKYKHARDFWRKGARGEIIRVHVVPRFQLFTPVGSVDCPVDLIKLEAYRDTFREGGTGERDFWTGTNAHRRTTFPWTGETVFYEKRRF